MENKTLEDRITTDIKPFEPLHHPVFKDALLELQEQIHKFNEAKKRINRSWRYIFVNDKYNTGYVLGKRGTVSLINYEKKVAVVLTVTSSTRNKQISIERLNKYNDECPGYKLVYAVLNGPSEEYCIGNVFCLSGDKVLEFILSSHKQIVLDELRHHCKTVLHTQDVLE